MLQRVDAECLDGTQGVNPLSLSAAQELHDRCGVYTKAPLVEAMLDAVGWRADVDLTQARLLEPAAGDGAFVVAAAKRLIQSLPRDQIGKAEMLFDRIVAFELLGTEAEKARDRLYELLSMAGLSSNDALEIAKRWVRTADFLIDPPSGEFTHVVGNPPYCRWSRLPSSLRTSYEAKLNPSIAKGDIFLPFLDRAIELLRDGGILGLVCSDRWKYMAFAEEFRRQRLPQVTLLSNDPVDASQAFVRNVDTYSTALVLRRTRTEQSPALPAIVLPRTIREAGFRVRVGPALGCTPAYVLQPEDQVEQELLAAFIDGKDIREAMIEASGRRVIAMHEADGSLIDLARYPLALARLTEHRQALDKRAVVRASGRPWYAPIDRVRIQDWAEPKLLVPELAKTPRVAKDTSGSIPSHGVYAVFGPNEGDLDALLKLWRDGGLAKALEGHAPKVKGGYVRCYKRFLDALPAP